MAHKSDIWIKELLLVKAALEENQIYWFIDMGTLLGAIRDGDFIAWDNDIDIGVLSSRDLHEKLLKTCEILELEGFEVAYYDKAVSIIKKNGVEINIAIYTKNEESYTYKYLKPGRFTSLRHGLKMLVQDEYHIHFKRKRESWARMLFVKYKYIAVITQKLFDMVCEPLCYTNVRVKVKYLENLRSLTFRGVEINVPALAEEYLSLRYGEDWIVPKQQWIYHKDDKSIIK